MPASQFLILLIIIVFSIIIHEWWDHRNHRNGQ